MFSTSEAQLFLENTNPLSSANRVQHFNLLLIRFTAETFYRNTMGVLPLWALGF